MMRESGLFTISLYVLIINLMYEIWYINILIFYVIYVCGRLWMENTSRKCVPLGTSRMVKLPSADGIPTNWCPNAVVRDTLHDDGFIGSRGGSLIRPSTLYAVSTWSSARSVSATHVHRAATAATKRIVATAMATARTVLVSPSYSKLERGKALQGEGGWLFQVYEI